MAYLDDVAVSQFLKNLPVDLLITHQGPSSIQGDGGSDSLQKLLTAGRMRCWCHGHSIRHPEIVNAGPNSHVRVVPLKDATFIKPSNDPGCDCFAAIQFDSPEEPPYVKMSYPQNWWHYHRRNWFQLDEQRLVSPDLAQHIEVSIF